MAVASFVEAINELRNGSSLEAQVAALRHLKNEAVGHVEKKEALVTHGILEALSQALATSARTRGKRKGSELADLSELHSKTIEEDEVRLQAVLVVMVLANGGPAFVTPILASSITPQILAATNLNENEPRIILAALRAIASLAESSRYTDHRVEPFQASEAGQKLYSKQYIGVLASLLSQKISPTLVRDALGLICRIIIATCTGERHRIALMNGGILDLLAARLASCYAYQKARPNRPHHSIVAGLPAPPEEADLHLLFGAITSIIAKSRYRVGRLLYSPVILAMFPHSSTEGLGHSRAPSMSDFPLPRIYLGTTRNDSTFSKAFPALGSVQGNPMASTFANLIEHSASVDRTTTMTSNLDSSVVSWILHVIRSEQGLNRVEAAHLITLITQAGFVDKGRDRMLALLILPLLVEMIDGTSSAITTSSKRLHTSPDIIEEQAALVRERASLVLADLLSGREAIQRAAVEAHSIKKVCKLLKSSFEFRDIKNIPWSPESSTAIPASLPASCRLGLPAVRKEIIYQQKCREGALLLLAAIAEKDDRYRKALTDQGIISCIIDALAPYKDDTIVETHSHTGNSSSDSSTIGNPVPVLLAACKAATALSRSVSILRTSLIDAGIAKPIFALLQHPNVAVLYEATNVVCNLTLEFSPMRHDLVEAGAIKTLCEHAHSADTQIRLVSLWALKHLVLQSPNAVKEHCLEELGPGWLIQVMTGGSNSNGTVRAIRSTPSSLPMGVANAAGERVDILNAIDEPMELNEDHNDPRSIPDQSLADSPEGSEEALIMSDETAAAAASLVPWLQHKPDFAALSALYQAKLKEVKDSDDRTVALSAHNDELQICMQGLDFVRNLIQGADASEMIDILFQNLGANRVFDILADKLNPSPPASFSVSNSSYQPQPPFPTTSPDLLNSAVFILVHLAAGSPRHRQQLISQPNLLRALIPLLSHPETKIRVSCVWVINNLTWIDDNSDLSAAKQRALELRRLGFEEVLNTMTNDSQLDVKDRVTTAKEQMSQLLEPRGGHLGGGPPGVGAHGRTPSMNQGEGRPSMR